MTLEGLRPDTDSMLRVDQAGEYGATRIYAGQLAVMGTRTPAARAIAAGEHADEATAAALAAEAGEVARRGAAAG
jgi:demethoxyubiquinone hydroxylase (CLK1/Coq7/Cat5 family)